MTAPRLMGLPEWFTNIGGWGFTLIVAMLGWIPFRAHDLGIAMQLYGRLFDLKSYASSASVRTSTW